MNRHCLTTSPFCGPADSAGSDALPRNHLVVFKPCPLPKHRLFRDALRDRSAVLFNDVVQEREGRKPRAGYMPGLMQIAARASVIAALASGNRSCIAGEWSREDPVKRPLCRQSLTMAKILNLLMRPGGTSVPELRKTTRWQAHSVRSFLSGALKKKLGPLSRAANTAGPYGLKLP